MTLAGADAGVDIAWEILAFAGLTSLLSAATTALLLRMMVAPLATAVRGGRMTNRDALARFGSRAARAVRNSLIAYTALLAAPFVSQPLLDLVAAPWPIPTIPPLSAPQTAGVAALGITIWSLTQVLVGIAFRQTRSFATLNGTAVPAADAIKQGIAMSVRCLAGLVLFEAMDLLVVFGQLDLLWLIPLGAGLGFLVYRRLAPYEQRWFFHSTRIGQTHWASLAPRIEAWAARSRARIRAVLILANRSPRIVGASLLGGGRPTLFLSESLLASMDWRQQDALIAMLVGAPRLRAEVARTKLMWVVGEAAILAFFGLALAQVDVLDSQAVRSVNLVIVVLLVAFAITVILGRINSGYRFERYTRLGDKRGAELCGDPLALMVALHTAYTLRGNRNAVAGRISALNQLRQKPGPWAPWADAPVPSAVPFELDGQPLTVPLDSPLPPSSVPAAAFPLRGPIAVSAQLAPVEQLAPAQG